MFTNNEWDRWPALVLDDALIIRFLLPERVYRASPQAEWRKRLAGIYLIRPTWRLKAGGLICHQRL